MLVPRVKRNDGRSPARRMLAGQLAARPVLVEQLVGKRGDLVDLGLAEVTREHGPEVLDDALAAELVARLGRGADEHLVELVFAVFGIVGDLDLRGVLGERPQVLERLAQPRVEAAADLSGPADVRVRSRLSNW